MQKIFFLNLLAGIIFSQGQAGEVKVCPDLSGTYVQLYSDYTKGPKRVYCSAEDITYEVISQKGCDELKLEYYLWGGGQIGYYRTRSLSYFFDGQRHSTGEACYAEALTGTAIWKGNTAILKNECLSGHQRYEIHEISPKDTDISIHYKTIDSGGKVIIEFDLVARLRESSP